MARELLQAAVVSAKKKKQGSTCVVLVKDSNALGGNFLLEEVHLIEEKNDGHVLGERPVCQLFPKIEGLLCAPLFGILTKLLVEF
jgi:hypothetical protein